MRVNYYSPVRLTLAFLPRMISEEVVGSSRSRRSQHASTTTAKRPYRATKAAISAFMESFAVDLDGTDIRIHS